MEKDYRTDNTYAALMNYFDSRYGGDNERTNYAHVIKSMKEEHKVSALVKTYNKILKKLLIFTYGSEEYISKLWVEYGLTNGSQWVWNNLKSYLNDQIMRVFEETEYSDQLALECITNLREGSNEVTIKKYITSKSSEEVNALLNQIEECKKTIHEAPQHMSQYNMDTNEYLEYKPLYIKEIKKLMKMGYKKDVKDESFENYANIFYISDFITAFLLVIIGLFILSVIVGAIWILDEIGLIGVLILIGMPGAIISSLKKG